MASITTSAAVDNDPIEEDLTPGENLAIAMAHVNLLLLRTDFYSRRDLVRLQRSLDGLKQVAGIRG